MASQGKDSNHIVCPGCTCLCDDITFDIGSDGKLNVDTKCQLGNEWFQRAAVQYKPEAPASEAPASEAVEHVCSIAGSDSDFQSKVQSAAKLLSTAQAPLICGLDSLTTGAQQAAWKLADEIGATIDSSLSNANRGSMFALQRVGKVTASLGEVAQRSDLIVFWFCDPVQTHPRFNERYVKPGTRVIVVDDAKTSSAKVADEFIQLDRSNASAALAAIRAQVNGVAIDDERVLESTGYSSGDWRAFSDQLVASKYGAMIYGHPESDSEFELATDYLNQLVIDLNSKTRFVGLGLRNDANGISAENVLTWSSGFPFAVNHSRGYPRFCWNEYSAETVLSREECDVVLWFAGDGTRSNEAEVKVLSKFKTIVVTENPQALNFRPAVLFQVGSPGYSDAGDFGRLDDVLLPLDCLVERECSTTELVNELRSQVSES